MRLEWVELLKVALGFQHFIGHEYFGLHVAFNMPIRKAHPWTTLHTQFWWQTLHNCFAYKCNDGRKKQIDIKKHRKKRHE